MSSLSSAVPQNPAQPWAMKNLFNDPVVPNIGGRVKLTDVNPHLVCVLCHGYFVDATSIVECLHSFCRSCIVLHLDKNNFCPICREDIQNSKVLKPDKALQDIVYKLVPGLFHSEMKRRQNFYKEHPHRDMHLHPESRGISVDRIVYTADELISLSLEFCDKECEQEMWKNVTDDKGLQYQVRVTEKPPKCIVRKRYLKCPAAVRMSHLKKFIRLKYNLKSSDTVELLYRRESLPAEYSIMDIAYIYTWNRNEPMRFFYKINSCVTVPVKTVTDVRCTSLTENMHTEPSKSSLTNTSKDRTSLQSQTKVTTVLSQVVEKTEEDKTKTVSEPFNPSSAESIANEGKQLPKTEPAQKEPLTKIANEDVVNKDRGLSSTPTSVVSTVPLNPPISPEGTSRKENVSDNVRNNCANEPVKATSATVMAMEDKKSVDLLDQRQPGINTDVPMKKLEKLVDQQQQTSAITTVAGISTPSRSALPMPKKPIAVGESKLNLSITKLIMKNQTASAAAKFVPTLQQMQQIGMHTSIPSFLQQQQSPPTTQPNNYVRPGFAGVMHQLKKATDALPVRSQAPTNRPPFIPVRKSYEWNKARNLAAKPSASPVTNAKDNNKTNEKPSVVTMEKPVKKTTVDNKPITTAAGTCLSSKNSDEMNAAQSLLKVGQDIRFLKPPMVTDLHGKYNCESSLQITKVTEPETNQSPVVHEKHSNSQPSLQIMRVAPASEKTSAKSPAVTEAGSNGNATTAVKPVNKKPVPSLYSMPTKRTKDDHHNGGIADNKRIERRVDTENGVLSVSLLTETSKQDMDAKRREVVQPDVSIKLMTFATEPSKKTQEVSSISGGSISGVNNKRKLDEPNATLANNASAVNNHSSNKRRLLQDEPNSIGGSSGVNTKKSDESNPVNRRKQDEPERKVTPPKPASTKDDVPQLIEINSSPYAKLLPAKKQLLLSAKKQQLLPKMQAHPKQQQTAVSLSKPLQQSANQPKQQQSANHPKQQQTATPKQQLSVTTKQQQNTPKQQPSVKLQPASGTKVLDLSKSPPNVNGVVKRTGDSSGNCSPSKKKTTSPVQSTTSPIMSVAATSAATAAAINSNLLFAAQRQAAAFLLKQHFESLNNELQMRNGGTRGPTEWPRALFNPSLFARPPTNLNN